MRHGAAPPAQGGPAAAAGNGVGSDTAAVGGDKHPRREQGAMLLHKRETIARPGHPCPGPDSDCLRPELVLHPEREISARGEAEGGNGSRQLPTQPIPQGAG